MFAVLFTATCGKGELSIVNGEWSIVNKTARLLTKT